MLLQQYLQIFIARRKVIFLLATAAMCLAAAICFIQSKKYTAQVDLLIEAKVADPVTGANIPSQLVPGYLETQAQIIGSTAVALRVADKLGLVSDASYLARFENESDGELLRDWIANDLLKSLRVRSSKEKSIIELHFSDGDPERAASVANAFSDGYIATSHFLNLIPMKQDNEFFADQIRALRGDLEKAQGRLSDFQQANGILSVEERSDVDLEQLEHMSKQVAEAWGRATEAMARLQQAEKYLKTGSQSENLSEVLASSTIQQLKADLAQQERNWQIVVSRFAPEHPRYIETMNTMNALKRTIQEEGRRILNSATDKYKIAQRTAQDMERKVDAQKTMLLQRKKLRDEAAVLNRDVNNAQRAYDNALQRSGHQQLEGQTKQAYVAVLNPATPPARPSSPRLLRTFLIAALAGILIGGLIALLLEKRDRRIRSVLDMTINYSLPVLAEIGCHPVRLASQGAFYPRLSKFADIR
ncbi:Wzz/FepE/Etk N-terminal domain-containing protein [Noviherbaspirillum sp. 1P10PC]|uniref:Wzz/FepE/Etk N-terminal domain-containing protein n=1 Tax=Noviherbaspirillum sp. 1P10PC TaxID=3132292 RepID=UPI0039A18360